MRRRRRARERQKKREDKRPISKRLRAVLPRSFRGQPGKKMLYVRGVPGVTGTLGKADSHFHPAQLKRGWGPHHRVEAAVDWYRIFLLSFVWSVAVKRV